MDHEQWLDARRSGLGASDAPAVLGLSPWDTALGVYLDKIGQSPPREETPAMRWGHLLEGAIADAYQQDTGRVLSVGELVRHPDLDWLLATPDRLAGDRIVQLKTCSAFHAAEWGEPGTDEVPDHVLAQVHHEMLVVGVRTADVAVLIGGSDFRIFAVPRNDNLIDAMVEIERDFWRLVCERIPPPPNYQHPSTPELMDALYSPDGSEVTLESAEDRDLVLGYLRAAAQVKDGESAKQEFKGRIIERMGHAAKAVVPGAAVVRRKAVSRKGYTVAPSEYVSFSVRPSQEMHP